MANLRHLVLGATTTIALLLLGWMFVEQDKLTKCNKVLDNTQPERQQWDEAIEKLGEVIGSALGQGHSSKNDEDVWNYNWDKKAPLKQENTPSQKRTLILVRHGQYFFENGKLTPYGIEQANATGRRLKEMGLGYSHIIHSSMERAKETAEIIQSHLPHLPLVQDDMLREGGPVHPSPTITYWGLPDIEYHLDGPRLEAAFRKYFYRPDPIQQRSTVEIFVAHGNIFRFFVLRSLQLEAKAWMRVFIPHASITMLDCNGDGTVTMSRFGDSGHMPAHMVTY